jgi:hypothetical protein
MFSLDLKKLCVIIAQNHKTPQKGKSRTAYFVVIMPLFLPDEEDPKTKVKFKKKKKTRIPPENVYCRWAGNSCSPKTKR